MCASGQTASICACGLCKTYEFHEKQPGLLSSFRSLFSRKAQTRRALHDVNFTLNTGEAVGLLGPNGSGKSTLIKCLTGILTPDAGEIRVAGCVPQRRSFHFLRSIGVVLGQKSQLLWELPPWEGFMLHARMYGLKEETVRRRAEKLAFMLKVTEYLYTPLRRLSLGQRMKCEIIAVLLHQPSVLFLDEPTIGLDVTAKRDIRRFLRRLVDRRDITVLLSSHIMTDIEEITSRVLLLQQGRLVFDGQLDRLDVRMRLRRVKIAHQHLSQERRRSLHEQLDRIEGVTVHQENDGLVALVEPQAMQHAAERIFSPGLNVQVNIDEPRVESILAEYFDEMQPKRVVDDANS